jgi:hypothetical protein
MNNLLNLLLIYKSSIKKIAGYFGCNNILSPIGDYTDTHWDIINHEVGFGYLGDSQDEPTFIENAREIYKTDDYTLIIGEGGNGYGDIALIFDNSKQIKFKHWELNES